MDENQTPQNTEATVVEDTINTVPSIDEAIPVVVEESVDTPSEVETVADEDAVHAAEVAANMSANGLTQGDAA